MSHAHRYYENVYPTLDDTVIVQVKSVTDMGVYVSLLEYGDIEGMIPIDEMTHRRKKKAVRVGKVEVAVVRHLDEEKGYIDLSKKQVSIEEIVKCEQRWNEAKWVHRVVGHVASVSGKSLGELYHDVVWPLYRSHGNAYRAITEGNAPEPFLEATKVFLQQRERKIRADIDVICYRYDGIDSIKEALLAGLSVAKSDQSESVSIRLDATPSYMVTLSTNDIEKGIELVTRVCEKITRCIASLGGHAEVRTPAYCYES